MYTFVENSFKIIVKKLETTKKTGLTVNEILSKMEYFCSYQERCYKEVEKKLTNFVIIPEVKEKIFVHLIENNYLNEERFAKSFVRGKHNYKGWGKIRILQELKFREISKRNIEIALQEISNDTYIETFTTLAEKNWNSSKDPKGAKRNKKFIDFLLRKGYESNLIYDKLKELDKLLFMIL